MKITELSEITKVFASLGVPISSLCGAQETKQEAVAANPTSCQSTPRPVDIFRRDPGIGFRAFPGQRFATLGPR